MIEVLVRLELEARKHFDRTHCSTGTDTDPLAYLP